MAEYPVRCRNVYWKRQVWPFDKTKRSRLKKPGFDGEYRMVYFQRAIPIAVIPIAPLTRLNHIAVAVPDDLPWMSSFELLA